MSSHSLSGSSIPLANCYPTTHIGLAPPSLNTFRAPHETKPTNVLKMSWYHADIYTVVEKKTCTSMTREDLHTFSGAK